MDKGKAKKRQGRTRTVRFPEGERRRETLKTAMGCFLPEEEAEELVSLLTERFPSVRSILSAPGKELLRAGVPEECVRLLHTVWELAQICLEEEGDELYRIFDTASACKALRPKFLGKEYEQMVLLILNGRGQVIYNDVLTEGSASAVPVYVQRLAELCIHYSAQGVILAHNHPSGAAVPSRNDVMVTKELEIVLRGLDIWLEDHIIFAEEDYYSFRASGVLKTLRKENDENLFEEMQEARALEDRILANREKQ